MDFWNTSVYHIVPHGDIYCAVLHLFQLRKSIHKFWARFWPFLWTWSEFLHFRLLSYLHDLQPARLILSERKFRTIQLQNECFKNVPLQFTLQYSHAIKKQFPFSITYVVFSDHVSNVVDDKVTVLAYGLTRRLVRCILNHSKSIQLRVPGSKTTHLGRSGTRVAFKLG